MVMILCAVMVARVATVAFRGIDAEAVDVQAQMASGLPAFSIVGLGDKAVAESRERVRAALVAIGLGLPPKRITINLAPADMQKEGSHYDLPIALALLQAMEIISVGDIDDFVALGELSLDGRILPVSGVLPAALFAAQTTRGLICPHDCGSEAAAASGSITILAPHSLMALVNHMRGTQLLTAPEPILTDEHPLYERDLRHVKGQESAKEALTIAAAGGHHMLMIGPPGAGKSMLASCMPSLLPPLASDEILEVSMIHSVAGLIKDGALSRVRPFRAPHHSASLPALVGGGARAKPGEISLSHKGVLFLDELPEFSRPSLEALRQPLESGKVMIARANAHVSYPARFQLIAAMNPCRCGMYFDDDCDCRKKPQCAIDYQNKISGPLYDRIDVILDVPKVEARDLMDARMGKSSAEMRAQVMAARERAAARFRQLDLPLHCNAEAEGDALERIATMKDDARDFLQQSAKRFNLSARAWTRAIKVARTIADLDGSSTIHLNHMTTALVFRKRPLREKKEGV